MNDLLKPHQCPRCFGLFKVGDRFWNDSGTVYHWVCWVNNLKWQSDNGQHMNIPSGLSSGTCWELAIELEQFIKSTPSQRTWVGLTKEEIAEFDTWHDHREEEVGWCNPSEIVAYIEAKLKQKNGYAKEKNT